MDNESRTRRTHSHEMKLWIPGSVTIDVKKFSFPPARSVVHWWWVVGKLPSKILVRTRHISKVQIKENMAEKTAGAGNQDLTFSFTLFWLDALTSTTLKSPPGMLH